MSQPVEYSDFKPGMYAFNNNGETVLLLTTLVTQECSERIWVVQCADDSLQLFQECDLHRPYRYI